MMPVLGRMCDIPMESPEEELVPSAGPELEMMSRVEAEPMEAPKMTETSSEPELLML